MKIHIHATKQGDVIKTVLINGSDTYETTEKCIWEGEYASIGGKIYSLEYDSYKDHKTHDEFIYWLCEIEPIRDLNFMMEFNKF